MTPTQITVTSTRPFSDGKYLNVEANTPTGPIEGLVWEQSLHHLFTPGAQLQIMVGQQKSDGAVWAEYKGKTRLEMSKTLQYTVLGGPQAAPAGAPPAAAPQAAPPAANPYGFAAPVAAHNQPPAQQALPAPTAVPQGVPAQAPPPNPQPAPSGSGGEGEVIIARAVQLMVLTRDQLVAQGFTPEGAERAAAQAPTICAQWWFGERSC